MNDVPPPNDALDRARRKAFIRLLPLLFVSYMIAYIDRQNIAVAKLTMTKDLPGFDNAVIGFGAGGLFLGVFPARDPRHAHGRTDGARGNGSAASWSRGVSWPP